MKKRHLILLSLAATLLSGCANGYKQFFHTQVGLKNSWHKPMPNAVSALPISVKALHKNMTWNSEWIGHGSPLAPSGGK